MQQHDDVSEIIRLIPVVAPWYGSSTGDDEKETFGADGAMCFWVQSLTFCCSTHISCGPTQDRQCDGQW